MGDTEMSGFIFAVMFLFLFPMMLSTIPSDFQGLGDEASTISPLDPVLLTGFESQHNWTKNDYSIFGNNVNYALGGHSWRAQFYQPENTFAHYRKILVYGVWLGGLREATFYCPNGTDRGNTISFSEIEGDAEEGITRYDMILGNGDSAGALIFAWNDTLYSGPQNAWNNNELILNHGLGIDETVSLSIGDLLLGLLFWQIPDVPFMLQSIIVVPIYADIAYIVWFIIINMIPFLGGG